MRWTDQDFVGGRRERRAFLWKPMQIDGVFRWLEWARWQEVSTGYYGKKQKWVPEKWLD